MCIYLKPDMTSIGTFKIFYLHGVPKLEGSIFSLAHRSTNNSINEDSNSRSYMGSGFTLWDKSAVSKGKKGKKNILVKRHVLE
ncbi:unnamed protein product [Cuscuta campestris]|uniref:Uncharacterized protein n=1 Tax=Cuscuta campestris TaxID=132261 RepID=A0A484KUU6_9ASTE|nr:unnamed protein product [Cuscuta campestris]